MNILEELRRRFASVLTPFVDDAAPYLDMVRPAQDARFGDYQANFAMPLAGRLGRPARDLAVEIAGRVEVADICERPEVAGPGFINLRLRRDWLVARLNEALHDPRLSVGLVDRPRTVVVDYSSPNVAKPMHVGHIRSTVIGDAICRTLRFVGHRVISDNHIGDWGTQFGMILFGYKHFLDAESYARGAVRELARLYQLVNRLVSYHELREALPGLERRAAELRAQAEQMASAADKRQQKQLKQLQRRAEESAEELADARRRVAEVDDEPPRLRDLAAAHPRIGQQVLEETARLHAGDAENLRLWHEFLPACRDEMRRIYERLDIHFDHELGESHYHSMLGEVVADFERRGLARTSDGALCVFLEGFESPMIIRKRDGAYLYSTTDLATIDFRIREWRPDQVLYVVDHRQSDHFDKLFAAARLWGRGGPDYRHIRFGTVCGANGKPFKSREGADSLEWLLDEAVAAAYDVISENDRDNKLGETRRREVSREVGHAAIKYHDLSQNRESDYIFDVRQMVANEGNTATYMQYAYVRVQGILRKGGIDIEAVRRQGRLRPEAPEELEVGLAVLRLEETLANVLADFRPNMLTEYVYDLARRWTTFYDRHKVLVDDPELRDSRLLLCDLAAHRSVQSLELLGIRTVDMM